MASLKVNVLAAIALGGSLLISNSTRAEPVAQAENGKIESGANAQSSGTISGAQSVKSPGEVTTSGAKAQPGTPVPSNGVKTNSQTSSNADVSPTPASNPGTAPTSSSAVPGANNSNITGGASAGSDAGTTAGSTAQSQPASNSATATTTPPASTGRPKVRFRPGEELTITTKADDLVPTDEVPLAQKQVEAYPDSPEAHFILAVALTRTSRVEDALKEVRASKKLAQATNDPAYFDKMISTYEEMSKAYPEDNRIRYALAWAYYMKAYLVAKHSQMVARWKAVNGDPANPKAAAVVNANAAPSATAPKANDKSAPALIPGVNIAGAKTQDFGKLINVLGQAAQGGAVKVPSFLDNTEPADQPQIKRYFELGLKKLDDLIARKPDDVWALVYRAHLKSEYTGDLDSAMKTWEKCKDQFPNNPAAYFFLGEGYMKQGNLKESVNHVSRAVALRAMGF